MVDSITVKIVQSSKDRFNLHIMMQDENERYPKTWTRREGLSIHNILDHAINTLQSFQAGEDNDIT